MHMAGIGTSLCSLSQRYGSNAMQHSTASSCRQGRIGQRHTSGWVHGGGAGAWTGGALLAVAVWEPQDASVLWIAVTKDAWPNLAAQ
jgi:hypothetical protein